MDRGPTESSREHFEKTLDQAVAAFTAAGHNLADAHFNFRVTELSDHDVSLVQALARSRGLESATFVDDRQPPRPGTTASATLHPEETESLTEARARRVLRQ